MDSISLVSAQTEILKKTFEKSEDGILLLKGSRISDCNPSALRMLRTNDKQKVLNSHPADLSPEKQADGKFSSKKANKLIAIAHKQGFLRFEWLHKRFDGENFLCEVTLTFVQIKNETVLHAVWREIGDFKLHQQKLEKSIRLIEQKQNHLNSIINTALDCIITINSKGIIQSFNPAACKLFGYTEQEIIGQNIAIIVPSPDKEKHDQYIANALQHPGKTNFLGTIRDLSAIKKNGLEFPIRLSINAVPSQNEMLFCGFIHDLSLQKQLEIDLLQHNELLEMEVKLKTEEFIKAKEIAEQANQTKSLFLANMSHELRTPLHGILSFAQLGLKSVKKGDLGKLERFFDRINISGERLLFLLNDLLDLAKLEAGQMKLDIQQHELKQVAENCVADFEANLIEKQLTIHWQETTGNTLANFDKQRISQVITNLLSNAIKFSEPGQSIFISFSLYDLLSSGRQQKPGLLCSIRDQGLGIPAAELDAVFDKFIQSSKTKSNAGGTGLGLAICQEIILVHKGKIWAEQSDDQGAIFNFAIPL